MRHFDILYRSSTVRVVSIMMRRHGRKSLRLRDYDYTTAGAYFVTICTRERLCSLEDTAWQVVLRTAWRRAVCGGSEPSPYDFVIMPNHVHGIVWLPAKPHSRLRLTAPAAQRSGNEGAPEDNVEAQRPSIERVLADRSPFVSQGLLEDVGAAPLLAVVKAGSLGAVVRAFKSASTIRINRLRGVPGGAVWQRGYYDRVIRGGAELARVREYIRDNPAKWDEDRNNPSNLAK